MAHYGTLGTQRFERDIDDIRGADVYGTNDDKLGEIKDVIFDHDTGNIQYVVVDTGGWLSSRKFIVPGNRIRVRRGHDDDFSVALTRDEIERLPAYNEKVVENEKDFRDYERNYRERLEQGPVLHKEGSTHTLTPEPDEMPAATGSGSIDEEATPDRLADKFGSANADPSKLRMRPSGTAARVEDTKRPGISQDAREAGWEQPEVKRSLTGEVPRENRHPRFQAFEDHLHRNRVDITASCRSCGVKRDKAA